MVQMFQGLPDPRLGAVSEIGQSIGQGLGDQLGNYYANKALEDVIADKDLQGKPLSERWQALQAKMSRHGPRGQKILQNRLMVEQQREQEQTQHIISKLASGEKLSPVERNKLPPELNLKIHEAEKEQSLNEKEQEVVGKILSGQEVKPEEWKHIKPENQIKVAGLQKKSKAARSVRDALIKAKYPEVTADLWEQQMLNAPEGGQTDVIKNVNDLIRRSKSGKGLVETEEGKEQLKPSIEIPGMDLDKLELDFPELPEPIGMTPADIVNQNKEREKVNTPLYSETVKHLNALDEEYRDIELLQDLNQSENIPDGINWNIDWNTGNLRFKSLASTETQEYVKTIARMARRAKDYFPGRVTNFDLEQFKEGFATLANSKEGREVINKQLALANRIAFLEDETLKASIDHYGSGADPHLIRKYAQENYRKLKSKLEKELKNVNRQALQMSGGVEKQSDKNKPNIPVEEAKSLEDLFG